MITSTILETTATEKKNEEIQISQNVRPYNSKLQKKTGRVSPRLSLDQKK